MRGRLRITVVGATAMLWLAPAVGSEVRGPPLPDADELGLGDAVHGTTAKAAHEGPRPWCAGGREALWYSTKADRRSAVVLDLHARSPLDAAVAVFHVVRSHVARVACARTGSRGRATISFYASTRGRYLIGVARRARSADGEFDLATRQGERTERPPGQALPPGGVRSSLNPVLDPADVWSVAMDRGTTYRFNVSSRGCVAMRVYRPGAYSFATAHLVLETPCGGYETFTPGPDGGGRYIVRLSTGDSGTRSRPYLFSFAPAELDDIGPGRTLANGGTVRDRISGLGIDNVDLYRIAVPRPNEQTTINFREKPVARMDLMLLRESGRTIRCACASRGTQRIRAVLPAGHYYVVVRSRDGSGGPYSLGVVTRDITTTTLNAGDRRGLEVPPGAPVRLAVAVTSAHEGGPVSVEIQRFDPLTRWQFSTMFRERVGPDGAFVTVWTPPSVGTWRAHARFFGTRFSSFSESDWIQIRVAEPLQ